MLAARLPLIVLAILCAVFGILLAASSLREAALHRGQTELAAGRNAAALTELERLDGDAAGRAAALRGRAYRNSGRLEPARLAFQTAVRRDPNNWVLQREYGEVLLALGERAKARARISRARALNPRMPLPPGFVEPK